MVSRVNFAPTTASPALVFAALARLDSQNDELKKSNRHEPTCKFAKLPLDFYFFLVPGCCFIVFVAAWLLVDGGCLIWRTRGGLLLIFSFACLGGVFWGLGKAIDCGTQENSYKEHFTHCGQYTTEPYLSYQTSDQFQVRAFRESGQQDCGRAPCKVFR
jgi:hypothetical protein